MSNIFYFGDNDTVHGPVTEVEVQRWYLNGYFSSDAKFQITSSNKFEPEERIHTLGELIDLNGRTVPFYLSSEKIDREKKLEEMHTQLIQEVETLRKNDQSMQRSQKDAITALQTQVTELVESNTNLQKQVDALSNKRETSPVTEQLEKKVNELKKRVDEQEKKVDSMKKEISAVNSKCDRNDSKLDKLMERQNSTDGIVTGFDKRVVDLKASEKTIRESLNTCAQNAESNSSQIQAITCDLGTIAEEMERQRETLSTGLVEMKSVFNEFQNALNDVMKTKLGPGSELDPAIVKAAQDGDVELTKRLLEKSAESKKSALAMTESDIPPWEREDKKVVVDAGVKKVEELPWEKTKAKQKASAPWEESREEPPWSKMNGSSKISSKNDTVVGAENAGHEKVSDDQKQLNAEKKVPSKDEQANVDVKPVSRVKDWAAICRELSDDEEEEEQIVATSSTQLAVASDEFVRDMVELLRVYCAAIDSTDYTCLMEKEYNCKKMLTFCTTCYRELPHYARIREELLKEVRRLAATPITCTLCVFSMQLPRHLFYHFSDTNHVLRVPPDVPGANKIAETNKFIAAVFAHFIETPQEIEGALRGERELATRGRELHERLRDRPVTYRPDMQFTVKMAADVGVLPPSNETFMPDGNPVHSIMLNELGEWMRKKTEKIKKFFSCALRTAKLDVEFKKHVTEGRPSCVTCQMSFVSVEEYYKHTATYEHACRDQSTFTICMLNWKGREYWDTMLLGGAASR